MNNDGDGEYDGSMVERGASVYFKGGTLPQNVRQRERLQMNRVGADKNTGGETVKRPCSHEVE